MEQNKPMMVNRIIYSDNPEDAGAYCCPVCVHVLDPEEDVCPCCGQKIFWRRKKDDKTDE